MPIPDSSPLPPEVRLLRVLYAVQVGLPIALFTVAVSLGPSRQAPLPLATMPPPGSPGDDPNRRLTPS